MKKIVISYIFLQLLLSVQSVVAQAVEATATTPKADGFSAMIAPALLLSLLAFTLIFALWAILRTNNLLYKRLVEMDYAARGLTVPGSGALVEVETESYWDKLKKKYWEDAVPIEKEHTIMGHHSFDGIRELDNNLPPWWLNMFYVTIAVAFIYMYYYEWGGSDWSSTKQYETEMAIAKRETAAALANAKETVTEANVTLVTEAGALGEGATIFKANCAACHGQNGEGTVGPNMTDEFWIHGGSINDLFRTIKVGVPEKGMQSWAAQLRPSDIQKVASYVLSLQGTKPVNPKAPEGEKYVPEAAPTAKDTTVTSPTSTTTPK